MCRQNHDALLSPLRDLLHHLPHEAAGNRVHAGRRLVQEDHGRLGDGRHAHGELPLVPTAELAGARHAEAQQVQLNQVCFHGSGQRRACESLQAAIHVEVLLRGEVFKQGIELRTIANELPDLVHVGQHVDAADSDLALGGRNLSAEHLEGGGLPCAVHSQEPEDLPLVAGERHAAHRMHLAAVDLAHIVHPNELATGVQIADAFLFRQHHVVL
mmetsp:Transcript_26680/g.42769  ORF Transcript_26680/g.42769 Transcript_26680/m.42769 type:complete len:214 (+) Transcript_26680:1540-2181(+)